MSGYAMHVEGGETALERATPWVSSFLMHAGFGLVAAFVLFAAIGRVTEPAVQMPAMVDTSEPDKLFQETAKSGASLEKDLQSMQNRLKNAPNGNDPFGDLNSLKMTVAGMSERAGDPALMIAVGPGGSFGPGDGPRAGIGGPGMLAPYGSQNLIGGGPWTSIPICKARRVVYLLDHSGSMLESFDYLREELLQRTRDLIPAQQFSVIMFSEDVSVLGPDQLQRATADTKRDVARRLAEVHAAGQNDNLLEPFRKGFEKAFAMKPELIIFLTDGNFDSRLVDAVKKMNKDKVQIQTIAFVEISPDAEESLKQIARDGGGKYKFVAKQDLK